LVSFLNGVGSPHWPKTWSLVVAVLSCPSIGGRLWDAWLGSQHHAHPLLTGTAQTTVTRPRWFDWISGRITVACRSLIRTNPHTCQPVFLGPSSLFTGNRGSALLHNAQHIRGLAFIPAPGRLIESENVCRWEFCVQLHHHMCEDGTKSCIMLLLHSLP
jgi:hypothetical protein